MTIKDNVLSLRDQYRPDIKTVSELERKIGLSNGSISQWAKSKPSQEKATLVAKFFKVPVDRVYNSESNSVDLDSNEEDLITLFRKNTTGMSDEETKKFNRSLDSLMKAAKNILNENDEDWFIWNTKQ